MLRSLRHFKTIVITLYSKCECRKKGHRKKGHRKNGHGKKGTGKMGTGKKGTSEKLGKKGTLQKKTGIM